MPNFWHEALAARGIVFTKSGVNALLAPAVADVTLAAGCFGVGALCEKPDMLMAARPGHAVWASELFAVTALEHLRPTPASPGHWPYPGLFRYRRRPRARVYAGDVFSKSAEHLARDSGACTTVAALIAHALQPRRAQYVAYVERAASRDWQMLLGNAGIIRRLNAGAAL